MPRDTVVTQEAADGLVGKNFHTGGIAGVARGTVTAATVVDEGKAVELAVDLGATS
jgi:hypothetical protein